MQRITKTYYTSRVSLAEVVEQLRAFMKADNLLAYPVETLEITAGLPKSDSGQTINVTLLKSEDATNFPAYETRYKDSILVSA